MKPKVSLTLDCFKYSTDGGNTWKELGKPIQLKVDDTDIAATHKHILKMDGEITINCDFEKYYNMFKKYYSGKFKEEENMNKVLELYYERKLNKLKEFYLDLEKQEYNKLEVVKEFNALNEEYTNKMEELRNKYNTIDKQFVVKTGYKDDNRYELSCTIEEDIHDELFKQYEVAKKEILEEKATIEAVLSLSEDKDYQVEVLKNYGILDKKGMMVEE